MMMTLTIVMMTMTKTQDNEVKELVTGILWNL